MGLFDKFRKKINSAVETVDADSLTKGEEPLEQPPSSVEQTPQVEEEWEEFDEDEELVLKNQDDEWEEWEDEEVEYSLPTKLSRKEKRAIDKAAKKAASIERAKKKEMKRRGAKEISRLDGSKVDLHMMRTTTGLQLVEIKYAPKGSTVQV